MLKEKIESALSATNRKGISILLQHMEKNGYYICKSCSHNHWIGGAAEHMWAVYLMAKAIRNQRMDEPLVAKYVTDDALAVICLLHDICDMHVGVYADDNKDVSGRHGLKSYWMMRNHGIGSPAEQYAVKHHQKGDASIYLNDDKVIEEYKILREILVKADHMASGTAWNAYRYKQGRTQHSGVYSTEGYLRAVAMDRSCQVLSYKMFMSSDYVWHSIKSYNRKNIEWNVPNVRIQQLVKSKSCLVVRAKKTIPQARCHRLRQDSPEEQELLIRSNLLPALYHSKKIKNKKGFRYEFTMTDETKQHYRNQKAGNGIICPQVTFFRKSADNGFEMVEQWQTDVLLITD